MQRSQSRDTGCAVPPERNTLTLRGHTDMVAACGYSPDGKWIVSTSNNYMLKLWEAATSQWRQTFVVDETLLQYPQRMILLAKERAAGTLGRLACLFAEQMGQDF